MIFLESSVNFQGVGGLTSGIEQAVRSGANTFGGRKCHGYHCGGGGVFSGAINDFVGSTINGFENGKQYFISSCPNPLNLNKWNKTLLP